MSDSMSFLNYLPTILYLLAEVILLVATFMLVSKHKSLATILMLIACFVSIVFTLVSFFAFTFGSNLGLDISYTISMAISSLGALASILFAVGLGMFAMNYNSKSE